MLQALDDAAAGHWCRAAVAALSASRGRLDELNVFPVPDGDTGTNMLLTAQAGLEAIEAIEAIGAAPEVEAVGESGGEIGGAAPATGESTWTTFARGAVLGARGNSGTLLAQLLRGLADQLAGQPADGPAFVAALDKAADLAYAAVADPEEGTFLTVARSAARAAGRAVEDGRTALAEVVRAAADGAHAALADTPGQQAVLREAGVVDAGGAGLCLVLDALVTTVTGTEPVRPPLERRPVRGSGSSPPRQPPAGPGSEVQYLLTDADEARVGGLRRRLAELGDSIVIVGVDTAGGRAWNVHVHTADPGAAIEAGIEAGRPYRVSVTPLAPVPPAAPVSGRRAVLAVVSGDGLAEVFRAEGVRVVPSPGPLAGGPGDPGAEDAVEELLLAEILGTAAHEVVVLPNGPDCIALAARAADRAREAGREVAVVTTRSPVQGLAAVAVADPARRFGEDVIAMAEAAGATRWAEVAVTDQEALTSAGRCSPGNVLGSAEGDVVVIGAELRAVACELLDRLLSAGGELATLVVGPDAALGDAVCAHLAGNHPTVEVTRYDGGPGTVPLLVGVE